MKHESSYIHLNRMILNREIISTVFDIFSNRKKYKYAMLIFSGRE